MTVSDVSVFVNAFSSVVSPRETEGDRTSKRPRRAPQSLAFVRLASLLISLLCLLLHFD